MRHRLIAIPFAATMMLIGGGITLAQAQDSTAIEKGAGGIDQFAFAHDGAIVDTTSQVPTTVPGMEVSFTTKPATEARALVRFCAEGNMFGTGTGAVQVVADVDGTRLSHDIQFFTFEDSAVKPRCYDWATGLLSRGPHSAKISWSLTVGPSAELTGRFHDSILTVLSR